MLPRLRALSLVCACIPMAGCLVVARDAWVLDDPGWPDDGDVTPPSPRDLVGACVHTVTLQLNDFSWEAGWAIVDEDGKTYAKVDPGTYRTPSRELDNVRLVSGRRYSFTAYDTAGDGWDGQGSWSVEQGGELIAESTFDYGYLATWDFVADCN